MVGKKGDVWDHFEEKNGGWQCAYCKTHYKHENATKMRKHLVANCLHCPDNIKSKLNRKSSVDKSLSEYVSGSLDLTSGGAVPKTASVPSTPESSVATTPRTSRSSTPNFPNLMSFADRMTDKENVSVDCY